MSSEVQRPDDSPSTSGGSSDIEQRETVPPEQEREQAQPKKKETKISSKTAAKLSTSAKRIQKELAEITLDPPPNCRHSELLHKNISRFRKKIGIEHPDFLCECSLRVISHQLPSCLLWRFRVVSFSGSWCSATTGEEGNRFFSLVCLTQCSVKVNHTN
uniref:Ubiquitin-conjugating enzyme E2 E2-like n=1 Tax=Poecilia latipinna TaxID=48699 RepID=A0A3B3TTU4_9TELE